MEDSSYNVEGDRTLVQNIVQCRIQGTGIGLGFERASPSCSLSVRRCSLYLDAFFMIIFTCKKVFNIYTFKWYLVYIFYDFYFFQKFY